MLLERESAISCFLQCAKYAESSGKILLIKGEAGIGKTALLEHMCNHSDIEFPFLWSGCDPLFTPRPYAPFHDIADFLQSDLIKLLAETQSTHKTFHQIAHSLFSSLTQQNKPIILVIEDTHWADNATLDLLKFIVRRISFTKCLLCLSYRDDEVVLEHPFSSVLSLCPAAHTKRLHLKPLSVKAIAKLGSAISNRALATHFSLGNTGEYSPDDLHRITGGNPFFLTEIMANQSNDDQPIPSSITDAVSSRLKQLKEPERKLMLTLSLIPYSIPAELITHLFGEQGETLAMACAARKLLQFDARNEFRFIHELARLATLACLSLAEQKQTHLAILSGLEDLKLLTNLAWLTHHAVGGQDAQKVLEYAPLAAHKAANLGAHKEAALNYQKALTYVEYADTELAASLYENWAYEVSLTTHMEKSVIEARRCAITLYRALDRQDKIGENLRHLSRLYWYQGEAEKAEQFANEAIKTFEKIPASSELAMAYSIRSQLDMLNERTEESLLWGNKALALENKMPNPLVKVHALTNIGSALLMAGRQEGEEILHSSLDLAEQNSLHEEAARVYTNYSDYCVRYKRLELAEELTSKGIEYDTSHDLDSWTYYLVGIQASLRLEQGRLLDANTIAEGVRKLSHQTVLMKIPASTVMAKSHLRLGLDDAESLLNEALSQAIQIAECQYIIPLRVALMESAWLLANKALAFAQLNALEELPETAFNPWQIGEILGWCHRLNIDVSSRLLGYCRQHKLPSPWQHELDGNTTKASELWMALGMPYEAALPLIFCAEDERISSFTQAVTLLEKINAKAPLKMLHSSAKKYGIATQLPKIKRGPYSKTRQHPVGLTAKEQQVLKLLSTGASNPDIAQALSRSQRTIENHVSSVLSKLQVDSRIGAILRIQNEPWLLE